MRQQHRTLHETLEATPKAVREARQLLVDFTRRCCPHSQQTVDGVALTVSEAVGNVVRHAYLDQTGTVEICASIEQESLIITISDHGVGRATPSLNPGQGLGLTLMQRIADAQIDDLPNGGVHIALRFPCISDDTDR